MEMNVSQMSAGAESRRVFLKRAATATVVAAAANSLKVPVYGQNQAPSTGRVIGANDRIVVGYIGLGGQGTFHLRLTKENASANNIVQAAVCDVWSKRTEAAKAVVGGDCKAFDDYRKLLEMKELDAVFVATVDHWHTRCSVDAMNAGKHVYVEKPMTRYLGEAFEIYDAVKKTGRILQVGSQGCSDQKWHVAANLIKEGKAGTLVMGVGSYMRNNHKGEWNYTIDPDAKSDNVKWDAWLGPVRRKVSFNADHYFRWRKYYPYCAGLLGDLFPHKLHPYMLATGNPEFPTRVSCIGTKNIHTDKNTPGTPERDVPEMVVSISEFPSGYMLNICSSTVNEQGTQEMIRGDKASLYMGGNRVELKPERPYTDEIDPEIIDNIKPGEEIPVHHKNWFDCIRANKQPNANVDLATKVQTVVSLSELSDRMKITCLFDEKTRKVTTADGKEIQPYTYANEPMAS
jgi:predicted dehydrogenase